MNRDCVVIIYVLCSFVCAWIVDVRSLVDVRDQLLSLGGLLVPLIEAVGPSSEFALCSGQSSAIHNQRMYLSTEFTGERYT